MLKSEESELDSMLQKASGINQVVETKMKQVVDELPIKECELRVEQELKENGKDTEGLQKQVESLRKQQEEWMPRTDKLEKLMDRIQFCTEETQVASG
jgi:hypothetical protein